MKMHLSQIALATQGQVIGEDVLVSHVGSDSRNIQAGELFVALKGEHFDGHDYADQTLKHGASAVMVETEGFAPSVVVKNTRLALGDLAAYWRNQFTIPVIAVTGSNGKTTVKEMLASILKSHLGDEHLLLSTQGNLNNDIGLPMTLLKLEPQHQFAVLEMGMNHLGEIRYLTQLAKPTIALINNASAAHVGEVGSLEDIAQAKAEIYEGLSNDGIALINVEDRFASLWKAKTSHLKQVTFGLHPDADVSARYQLNQQSSAVEIVCKETSLSFNLPVPGLHNVKNALAAATVAIVLGIPNQAIVQGLEHFVGVKGRLQIGRGKSGCCLIDDSYNANPASMKAAVDVLSNYTSPKIFVMGAMAELGNQSSQFHEEVGEYAKSKGIDRLLGFGEMAKFATRKFGEKGQYFETIDALIDFLMSEVQADATVLVKGSRSMRMERVVHALQVNGE
jgi:UDP-N-acetylmuramoyl-tripeptide--D-alanyl-D-alanine ligase